jgi:hypothetical protein
MDGLRCKENFAVEGSMLHGQEELLRVLGSGDRLVLAGSCWVVSEAVRL